MQISKQNLESFAWHFFKAEKRRINEMTKKLITKNSLALNRETHGFILAGNRYKHPDFGIVHEYPGLHFTLMEEASKFENEKTKLELDTQMILQLITKIAYRCKNIREFRDAIPECTVSYFNLQNLDRNKEEGWVFADNHREMGQFKKVAEKMAFYSVSHLMQ